MRPGVIRHQVCSCRQISVGAAKSAELVVLGLLRGYVNSISGTGRWGWKGGLPNRIPTSPVSVWSGSPADGPLDLTGRSRARLA